VIERQGMEENACESEQADGPEDSAEQYVCFEREASHSIR
jgi:hypothetical protein